MPTVTTNTAANSALRFLNYNSMQSGSSVSKLASGSRIVKASDDAAGLAIGTRLNSDVTVLRQSAINASQGGSIMAVADGGLARIADVLQRLKALAAQSLSGVPTDTERGFIDAEFQSLLAEIDGMAATTRFNGDSLLDGTTTQQSYFVGTDPTDVIAVDFTSFGVTPVYVGRPWAHCRSDGGVVGCLCYGCYGLGGLGYRLDFRSSRECGRDSLPASSSGGSRSRPLWRTSPPRGPRSWTLTWPKNRASWFRPRSLCRPQSRRSLRRISYRRRSCRCCNKSSPKVTVTASGMLGHPTLSFQSSVSGGLFGD